MQRLRLQRNEKERWCLASIDKVGDLLPTYPRVDSRMLDVVYLLVLAFCCPPHAQVIAVELRPLHVPASFLKAFAARGQDDIFLMYWFSLS